MGSQPRPGWRFRYHTEATARFFRVFSLGATLLALLVGVSTADGVATVSAVAWAILIGVLFHTFADVANDVVDLPIDRTDPRRAREPLVRGTVRPEHALVLALLTLPLMLAAVRLSHSEGAATALTAAIVLIGGYDVIGKSIPLPFVADFIEGAGGGALVIAGAGLAGGATSATLWAAGFIAVYIAMANGLHGAIRDVENDRRAGARTTAAVLGVRIKDTCEIIVPATVAIQGLVLQALLGALLAGFLISARPLELERSWSLAAISASALYLASTAQLLLAHRARVDLPAAMAAGTWHLFLAPASLLAAATWRMPGWTVAVTVASFVAPPLLYGRAVRGTPFGVPSTTAAEVARPSSSPGRRLAALTEMTRPGTPAAAAVLVVIGAYLGSSVVWAVLPAMLATALAVAAANVYNDRCDITADRINRPDRPLPAGVLTANDSDRFVLAAALGVSAFSLAVGVAAAAVTTGLLVLGLSYSVALQRILVLGPVSVAALFAAPLPYGGWVASGHVRSEHWIAAALVALFVFARETLKAVPDRVGDMAAGYHTVATARGEAAALAVFRRAGLAFCALAVAASAIVDSGAYLLAALVCAVAPTLRSIKLATGSPSREAIDAAISFSGLVFSLGVIPMLLMK